MPKLTMPKPIKKNPRARIVGNRWVQSVLTHPDEPLRKFLCVYERPDGSRFIINSIGHLYDVEPLQRAGRWVMHVDSDNVWSTVYRLVRLS